MRIKSPYAIEESKGGDLMSKPINSDWRAIAAGCAVLGLAAIGVTIVIRLDKDKLANICEKFVSTPHPELGALIMR